MVTKLSHTRTVGKQVEKARGIPGTQRTCSGLICIIEKAPTHGKERQNFLNTIFTSRVIHTIPNAWTSAKYLQPLSMSTLSASGSPKCRLNLVCQTLRTIRKTCCKVCPYLQQSLARTRRICRSYHRDHIQKWCIINNT